MRFKYLASMCALLCMGCVTEPTQFSDAKMTRYDKDTEYAVTPNATGFAVAINYSRYQYRSESDAIALACKSALTSIAYEYADKQSRKIQPINEQRIRLSMGRNGVVGITSCSAAATAEWLK